VTSGCHAGMMPGKGVHAAVAAHSCQSCHAPDSGGHKYPLSRPKDQLCVLCHDLGAKHLVEHKAMTPDACLACHDPHSTKGPSLLTQGSTTQTCLQCHPRPELPVQHAPYATDRCELCHDPHGSDTRALLLAKSPTETCRTCHAGVVAKIQTAAFSHASVKGACVGCHAPHAAAVKGLLSAPISDTCISCHEDIGRTVSTAKVPHSPVTSGQRCLGCHDAHASDQPDMLTQKQQALCLSCHSKAVTAEGGRTIAAMTIPDSLQTAPAHENCANCHNAHGSDHASILREANVKLPSGPYDPRNSALCFSCHDATLAQSPLATNFRDGDKNLHRAHMQAGERSRSCSSCHDPHATDQPVMIAPTVRFEGSSWSMPMNFVRTPEGGRCGSGCHEPLSYSRTRKPGGAP